MISTHKRLAFVVLALALGAWVGVQPAQGTDEKPTTPADPSTVQKTDVHGDPLPDGALARMGTLRWRHAAAVTFVGYTAKGKEVVTGCADGIFRVWDAASGKEVRRFANAAKEGQVQLPGGGVMMVGRNGASVVVMSPDGGRLATQAGDGTVQVWDVAAGKVIPTAPKEAKPMVRTYGTSAMAFSRDGKLLAVRGADQTLRVLDLDGKQEPRNIGQAPDPKQGIRYGGYGASLAFLADGKSLASLTMEVENQMPANLLRTFDLETGKEIRQLKAKENNFAVSSLAVSADGKILAWAQQTGILFLDADSGKEIGKLALQQNAFIGTVVFSPNGKMLATRSANNAVIQLWDVDGAKELGQLGEVAAPNFRGGWMGVVAGGSIAFSPDSATLVEGTAHNTVRFWNVADKKVVQSAGAGHHGGVSDLALSADGKTLITYAADRSIRQWDMTTGEPKAQLSLPADAATVVLAANGKLAASASLNNTVKLWDLAEGKESRVAIAAAGGPRPGVVGSGSLALSSDSKLLAMRGPDQAIRIYETESGKEVSALNEQAKVDPNGARFFNYYANTVPLTFLPRGAGLASVTTPMAMMGAGRPVVGSTGNAILLWNLPDKRPRRIESPTQPIRALAFSRDGRTIVTIKADNKVSLLESLTGQEYLQIELKANEQPAQPANNFRGYIGVPTAAAPSLALSPDGRTLAIGEKDIRLWDLRSGKELGKFTGHQAQVSSLLFASDNRTLISGSADTTALVWDAGRFIKHVAPLAVDWTAQQKEDLWKDLAGDAAKGIKAMVALQEQPKQAVAVLKDRLKPAVGVDAKRIEELVTDLASEQYPVRKKATEELEKLGELAQPAIEKAQTKEPTLETQRRLDKLLEKILNDQAPTAQVQQALRAMQVLEEVGSPDASQLLQTVAQGAPGHRLTRHAEQALKRLGK